MRGRLSEDRRRVTAILGISAFYHDSAARWSSTAGSWPRRRKSGLKDGRIGDLGAIARTPLANINRSRTVAGAATSYSRCRDGDVTRTTLLVSLAVFSLQAQQPAEAPVLRVLVRSELSLAEGVVWRRLAVNNDLDLVLALGTPKQWPVEDPPRAWMWWGAERRLGIFLQDRQNPGRVFTLSIAEGSEDCGARIVRMTVTDTVISCDGEKSSVGPSQKFVYDLRAKQLIGRVSYKPYFLSSVVRRRPDGLSFTASNGDTEAGVDFSPDRTPQLRIVSRKAAEKSSGGYRFGGPRFGPSNAFRLIQLADPVDCDNEVVVSERLRSGVRHYRMSGQDCDRIGPWQLEGDRLWFGKTFYAGEGRTGTGGFGYFDPATRQFTLSSAPELSDWSASAILVQPDAVWLALCSRGEYGDGGGGLIRYDRSRGTYKKFNIGISIGRRVVALGDRILLATDSGIVVIHNDDVKSYIVDQTTDGRLRIVEGLK